MPALNWNLSALFAGVEATFALDPDATGAAYKFLKAAEISFQPLREMIERPAFINDLTRIPHVMGAKGGSLAFKMELKGSGSPATAAAIAPELDALLTAALGTVVRGTGSTVVAAGSTTSVVNVTSSAGFSVGMMAIFNCGATYGYVPRFVLAAAGNVLTLDRALPAIPANLAVVHASNKYTRANSGHASLSFVGKRDSIEYTFVGCKLEGIKISGVDARSIAMVDLSFAVTDWTVTTKASLPATAPTGITAVAPPVNRAACFAVAGTEEYAYGLDFDFGLKFVYQDSTCALGPGQPDSMNAGQILSASEPKGTVKAYQLAGHLTNFNSGTELSLAYAAGAGLGNAWGLYIPKAQWGQPTLENHNGMIGESLPFMVNDNGTNAEYYLCLA